jgi:hypothetical protein
MTAHIREATSILHCESGVPLYCVQNFRQILGRILDCRSWDRAEIHTLTFDPFDGWYIPVNITVFRIDELYDTLIVGATPSLNLTEIAVHLVIPYAFGVSVVESVISLGHTTIDGWHTYKGIDGKVI